MASHHMLARGLCLLIVCASSLSLAVPVNEERDTSPDDEYADEYQSEEITTEILTPFSLSTITPVAETNSTTNVTTESSLTSVEPTPLEVISTSTAVMSSNSTTSSGQNVTKAAIASVNSTESTLTTTSTTSTLTEGNEEEGTAPDEDKSTGENEKGPVIIQKKDGEYRFWWSDSTWLSVVIPVSVGLGSALILICWICCFRWICCRRCGRNRSFYKKPPRALSGPAKKALREDFRQLRAKDRMKLLAESSDEEF